ncbi:MAG: hypothetical protein HYS62_03640 [Candidatus Aenigmarchaeota archaeon]|nr:hypothetical protein [Candidatus Aenigmarchaeota archaeon]
MVEKLNPFLGQGGLRPVQRVIGYVSGVMSRGGLADTTGVYMGIHRRGREVHLGKLSVQLPGSDVQYQPERLVPGKRVPITEDEMRARGY